MGIQGFTYSHGAPRVCACGRHFRPSVVIERSGGGRALKCPQCTAATKKAKQRKKQD